MISKICSDEYDKSTCMLLGIQTELSMIALDLTMVYSHSSLKYIHSFVSKLSYSRSTSDNDSCSIADI